MRLRRFGLWRFLPLLLFLCPPVQAQTGSNAAGAYRVGERLSYNVSFSNFPTAAHAELQVVNRGTFYGREGIELRAHVNTIGVVSAALYAINSDFISYVDPSTGLPFRSQQVNRDDALPGDDQAAGNDASSAKPPPPPAPFSGASDLLSAIYRARSLPLATGAVYPFTVRHNAAEYRVEMKVTGRQLLRTNIGSFNTVAAQVQIPGDKEFNAYRLRLNFTDDEFHIPVLFTAQLASGEIRAEIVSSEVIPPAPDPALMAAKPGANPTPNPPAKPLNPRGVANPTEAVLPGLPFKAGEELNFNFFVSEQAVGKASLQVRPRGRFFDRDGLQLAATLETTAAGQRLFPVNDQISSYVDPTTLLPFRTELKLQEGRRRASLAVNITQERGAATFDDGTRLEIPVGTHDLISVFYALRSFDLTPQKRSSVSLLINKRPRLLIVTALQRQTIEVGGQRIPAVQLSLLTDDAEGDRFALRLWVTTDSRRLPVRLTATTPFGPLRADLAILPVSLQ